MSVNGEVDGRVLNAEEPSQEELVAQLAKFLAESKLGARDLWSLEVAVATARRAGAAGALIVTMPATLRDPVRMNFNVGPYPAAS